MLSYPVSKAFKSTYNLSHIKLKSLVFNLSIKICKKGIGNIY